MSRHQGGCRQAPWALEGHLSYTRLLADQERRHKEARGPGLSPWAGWARAQTSGHHPGLFLLRTGLPWLWPGAQWHRCARGLLIRQALRCSQASWGLNLGRSPQGVPAAGRGLFPSPSVSSSDQGGWALSRGSSPTDQSLLASVVAAGWPLKAVIHKAGVIAGPTCGARVRRK